MDVRHGMDLGAFYCAIHWEERRRLKNAWFSRRYAWLLADLAWRFNAIFCFIPMGCVSLTCTALVPNRLEVVT